MMTMIKIDKTLISELFDKALVSERKRMNYDLRTSPNDGSQRMLNALLPRTEVAIHRHPSSNENVILICGKLVEVLYDDEGNETARYHLDPTVGNFGCVVPAGAWHSVEVLEPSVIYEAKDGKYGEDGSEVFDGSIASTPQEVTAEAFNNCLGNLKKNIEYLIGKEHAEGNLEEITPEYVSRVLNVPLDEVEKVMR